MIYVTKLPVVRQLLAILFATACSLPNSIQAKERVLQRSEYSGRYKSFEIKMIRSLTELGNGRFMLHASAKNIFASIEEYEVFAWENDHAIRPIKYRYKQRIFGVKKTRTIDFHWDSSIAVNIEKKNRKEIKIPLGTLGPMSYQLQLQLDLINHRDLLEYHFVSRGKLKNYKFNRAGIISLKKQHTLGVEKALLVSRASSDEKRKADLWFDIENHYNLVKIAYTKKGKTNSMSMVSDSKFPPYENTPYSLIKIFLRNGEH